MHRLFKIASAQANRNVPTQSSQWISFHMSFCTLCNRKYVFSPGNIRKKYARNVSTKEFTELLGEQMRKKTKNKRPKKKFAELVEVNENHSNVTKARVKKLTAEHMTQLTGKPEITLEQLHRVMQKKTNIDSSILKCDKNFKLSDSLSNVNLFPINSDMLEKNMEEEIQYQLIQHNTENIDMFLESDLRFQVDGQKKEFEVQNENGSETNSKYETKKKPCKSSSKKKRMTKSNMSDECKKLVNETFNHNLISFIDLCINCDFLLVASSTLHRYYKKSKYTPWCSITDPIAFSSLMHGFASKADTNRILDLMRLMNNCKVAYTPQTFAACFECIGRLPASSETDEKLETFRTQLESNNYTLQNLFDTCTFVKDQQEYVLKAVQRLNPNFVPYYHPPVLEYSNPLLTDLNNNLNEFRSPADGLFTTKEMTNLIQEQIKIEMNYFAKIKSVAKVTSTEEIEDFRRKWENLQNEWRMSVREGYARELKTLKLQQSNAKLFHSLNIYPYLKALTAEQYVDIILQEVHKLVQGSESYSPHTKFLYREMGNKVQLIYETKCKQHDGITNKINKIYKDYCAWYLNPKSHGNSRNTRQRWQSLVHAYSSPGPSIDVPEKVWTPSVRLEIGKFLYNIIVRDIKIDVNIFTGSTPKYLPAFYTLLRNQGVYQMMEMKPHPQLVKLYRETMTDDLFFDVNLLPMVSPPVPWTSLNRGCYIVARADFIRMSHVRFEELKQNPVQKLYPAFDALNQLASIPWRINEQILDIVLQVFREGGSKKLEVPQPPSKYQKDPKFVKADGTLSFHHRLTMQREKAEMYSLWCEALYRLSLANHYRKRIFWLPHNMDFRGRVYPLPPHLTHLGSDLARSLLRFAKGEKLGPSGLDWLKIHCVNLTGSKKRDSKEERLRYANDILPDILDSAENPLTGKMWWAKSDDKWQTLACCMEIKAVLDSGDAENFVSYFPVHQDGSCNGLQHYAALGRDQAGAESVNLTSAAKPQDVYSCVVALVEEERKKDAENGIQIAKNLDGIITRKIIKQTIMTTVYGVTKYGGRLQIAKQLKDVENFPKSLVWQGSLYLVEKTFLCLQEMFTSSKEIQGWFVNCAKHITHVHNTSVKWETPLGLLVVQPYFKNKTITLNDKCREMTNFFSTISTQPNLMKQKNAFPPNFVHSLDSSHMMLTSIYCENEGITFISVHDCYWTHPCFVDKMNKICRQQFVKLHSQPILENLSTYFTNTYKNKPGVRLDTEDYNIFSKVPEKGTYNLDEVLQSVYFFS